MLERENLFFFTLFFLSFFLLFFLVTEIFVMLSFLLYLELRF